jgi:HAD superfamily hydrolase (TIGR01549 family)
MKKPKLKLAIFDMDGTVFESYLDWPRIKEELNINIKNGNILKEIYKENGVDYDRLQTLESYEEYNTFKTKPIKGISECLCFLESREIKTALITNNNQKNTDFLLKKFNLGFDTVITREMRLWKPDPDAFFYVMKLYHCRADEVISIGDSHYDIKAPKAANISNIFIIKKETGPLPVAGDDDSKVIYFNDFFHLKEILESYLVEN